MSKKLNVHVIANYFLPVRAGIETNIEEVYSRLVRMGWDVTVHTSKDTLSEKDILPEEELIKGIKVKRYKKTLLGFFPKILWANTEVICYEDFNVAAPHSLLLLYSSLLKIVGRKKFTQILTPHGGYTHDWQVFSPFVRVIKKICHLTISRLLINYSIDHVRAVSEWEKKELEKYGIKKELITHIPYGLENIAINNIDNLVSKATKDIAENMKPYIIQIGRIHKTKNFEAVIQALPKVKQNINFLIVGPDQEDGYKKHIEKLISQLELGNMVKFAGIKEGADKYYLIKYAEMMVHMSHWESYGIVLLEAMSQGVVCITSNKYAMPTVVKNNINGYCINPDDEEKLIDKISFILKNKNSKMIKQMKQNNIKQASKLTWDKTAAEINKLLIKFPHKENIL